MGVARPPENSPKKVIQSTEGLNVDQWESININKFVPEALQQVLDAIETVLDTAIAAIEFAIEVAKLVAALISGIFDLIRAIIEALRAEILALLELLPKLDTGIYLLWIPTDFGGVQYYTNVFKSSLTDLNDTKRPPTGGDIPFRTMFFMWGYPWFDQEKIQTLSEIEESFKSLFGISPLVEDSGDIPIPDDFSLEKGFFTKVETTVEEVTNTVLLPEGTIVNDTQNKLRTTIKKLSRKSGTPGVSHNLTWEIPQGFSKYGLEKTTYTSNLTVNGDVTESYNFTKRTLKIVGIDIVRGDDLEKTKKAAASLSSPTINGYSLKGPSAYQSTDAAFVNNTVILHRELNSIPGTDFTVDFPPEVEEKEYYYSAAFVYQMTLSEVLVTKGTDGHYTVTHVKNTNLETSETINKPDSGILDDINFLDVVKEDVHYPELPLKDALTFVGPATPIIIASRSNIPAPSGGAQPDWISFKLLEDMLPEIAKFIDQAKNLINNIVDGILDDVNALEEWILESIASLQRILDDAKELAELLNGLLFPPMAGINFLTINTKFGMPGVVERYEKSLEAGLFVENGAYNPLLLDRGFQDANPAEYARRVNIPAYDKNHKTGGFILAFQEPAVETFLKGLMGLGDNFTEEFQQILNDSRLQIKNIQIPELKFFEPPTHPFVVVDNTNPDSYMLRRSSYKAGTDSADDPVNSDGDVEIKAAPGPYLNSGPPLSFGVSINNPGIFQIVVIPKGNISAQQAANLIPGAFTVEDGSFVITGKEVAISPCSEEAASLFGLVPGVSKKAANQNPQLEGNQFEVSDGDLIVELVDNGKSTSAMKQGSVPIFQLNPFNELLLSPEAYLIKINVEGEEQIIDVTGNLGTNDRKNSPLWEYTAAFPLTIEETVNDQFNFQITGTPVADGIDETINLVTIRPLTYETIHDINAEILRSLGDAGYPLGLFSTKSNTAQDGAFLFVAEEWAQTAAVTIEATVAAQDFLGALLTSSNTLGKDNVPYLINDVVSRLNAAFLLPFFSNENGIIRITGNQVGVTNSIKVFSSINNLEYATVALSLFGFSGLQADDSIVLGIGQPMTTFEYFVEFQQDTLCIELQESPVYTVETEPEFTVEILETKELDYIIEFA